MTNVRAHASSVIFVDYICEKKKRTQIMLNYATHANIIYSEKALPCPIQSHFDKFEILCEFTTILNCNLFE